MIRKPKKCVCVCKKTLEPKGDLFAILREFAVVLFRHFHLGVCGHRVLLQLLARRLPLPNVLDAPQEFHTAEAQRIYDRVLHEVQGFRRHGVELEHTTPMDQEWAVSQMTLASQFAIDVMRFLECGQYDSSHPDDEETHSMGSDDEYRPGTDRLRNQPGFEPHMLSRSIAATTATPCSTTTGQLGHAGTSTRHEEVVDVVETQEVVHHRNSTASTTRPEIILEVCERPVRAAEGPVPHAHHARPCSWRFCITCRKCWRSC